MCSLDDRALWDFGCVSAVSATCNLKEGKWTAALEEALGGSPSFASLERVDDEARLVAGVASLCLFAESNWTGPIRTFGEGEHDAAAVEKLTLDGCELLPVIRRPFYLWLASEALRKQSQTDPKLEKIRLRWCLRCVITHQKVLDDLSPSLLETLEELIKQIQSSEDPSDPAHRILTELEIHQIHITFKRLTEAESQFRRIKTFTDFKVGLKGAMGKRTKYQQRAVSQLAPDIIFGENEKRQPASETHAGTTLPSLMDLNDDVRLENILYTRPEDANRQELTAVEQMICLNTVQYLQLSQPKDALADEELFPYIDVLLNQKHGPWAARMAALHLKCKLESNHKRTVERAMIQCEDMVGKFSAPDPDIINRLSYIWASGMPLIRQFRILLADLMLSIGLVKNALDIYLELESWEEVIACYTILELRHKATEIIKQEIDKCPTVKLYCLLGDSTDDTTMYEKAWEFSKQRSSKAQRHWGNYLFSRKKYDECIPHYQKSCEINSLQESVWLRLGYAALMVENYELAATAYRRYTYLEPNSFEAWNNLAKVYVKQGNKQRAYKALSEALKFNYDSWQIWDNMSVVSLDTGHFDDVIRSYHRLLDLQKKHLDVQVLNLLVSSIITKKIDADGNSTERLKPKTLELLGRISAIHHNDPSVWEVYSHMTDDSLLSGQRLLKSCIILKQKLNSQDQQQVDKIVDLSKDLSRISIEAEEKKQEKNETDVRELLSSVRLCLRSIIAMLNKDSSDSNKGNIDELQTFFDKITEKLMNK